MVRASRSTGAFVLLIALAAPYSHATSVWNNPTGGLYSSPSNWIGGVPVAGTAVNYNTAGIYTVNVDVAATHGATQFAASSANVTLNITGSGYTIPDTVKIGAASGANNVFVSGSSFNPSNLELAPLAGGIGRLTLSGPLHAAAIALGGQITGSGSSLNETAGGLGTLTLNQGADLTTNSLLAHNPGSGSQLVFNGGTLSILGDGRLSASSAFTKVGDGTHAATLKLLDPFLTGDSRFELPTFTISNNATLNFDAAGGVLIAPNIIRDVSGSAPAVFNWGAGTISITDANFTLNASSLLSSNVNITPARSFVVDHQLSVASGSTLTISGGDVYADTFTVSPGGSAIYSGGQFSVSSGNLEIGPSGIQNPAGITLTDPDKDWLSTQNQLTIASGQSLTLNGGFIGVHGIVSNGGLFKFTSGRIQNETSISIGPAGQINNSPNLTLGADSSIYQFSGDVTIEPTQSVTISGGALIADHIINNGTLTYNSGTLVANLGDLALGPNGPIKTPSTLGPSLSVQAPKGTLTLKEGLTATVNGGTLSAKQLVVEGDLTLISAGGMTLDSVTIASPNGTAKLTTGSFSQSVNMNTTALYRGNIVVNNGTISAQTFAPPSNYAYNSSGTINGGTVYGYATQVGAAPGYVDTLTVNGGTFYTTSFTANKGAASQVVFNGGTILMDHADIDGPSAFVVGNGTTSATLTLWGSATSTLNFADGVIISANAQMKGEGIITGNVTNNGKLLTGQSGSGKLTINGTLVNSASLPLDISSATSLDKLTVNGTFDAGGVISFSKSSSYAPPVGTVFDLLDFTSFIDHGYKLDFQSAILPAGQRWDFSQFPIDGSIRIATGYTADFNIDGKVDTADYVAWRKGLRVVFTSNDLTTWRKQFGQSAGTGAEMQNLAVPEPSPLSTIGVFFAVRACGRRLRCRSTSSQSNRLYTEQLVANSPT
jgi:hypothetical protein